MFKTWGCSYSRLFLQTIVAPEEMHAVHWFWRPGSGAMLFASASTKFGHVKKLCWVLEPLKP